MLLFAVPPYTVFPSLSGRQRVGGGGVKSRSSCFCSWEEVNFIRSTLTPPSDVTQRSSLMMKRFVLNSSFRAPGDKALKKKKKRKQPHPPLHGMREIQKESEREFENVQFIQILIFRLVSRGALEFPQSSVVRGERQEKCQIIHKRSSVLGNQLGAQ